MAKAHGNLTRKEVINMSDPSVLPDSVKGGLSEMERLILIEHPWAARWSRLMARDLALLAFQAGYEAALRGGPDASPELAERRQDMERIWGLGTNPLA
jgi:hypothetical protein